MSYNSLSIIQVKPLDFGTAYDWYVEQSMAARGIANRIEDDFRKAAKDGCLVSAVDNSGEMAGMIFVKKKPYELELSGLIVHPNLYGTGLSAVLTQVAICVMVDAYDLERQTEVDVTCLTTASNRQAPRAMMTRYGFEHKASWYQKNAEGRSEVVEKYVLLSRRSLMSAAKSLLSFPGVLKNGFPCSLDLRLAFTFQELGETLLKFSES